MQETNPECAFSSATGISLDPTMIAWSPPSTGRLKSAAATEIVDQAASTALTSDNVCNCQTHDEWVTSNISSTSLDSNATKFDPTTIVWTTPSTGTAKPRTLNVTSLPSTSKLGVQQPRANKRAAFCQDDVDVIGLLGLAGYAVTRRRNPCMKMTLAYTSRVVSTGSDPNEVESLLWDSLPGCWQVRGHQHTVLVERLPHYFGKQSKIQMRATMSMFGGGQRQLTISLSRHDGTIQCNSGTLHASSTQVSLLWCFDNGVLSKWERIATTGLQVNPTDCSSCDGESQPQTHARHAQRRFLGDQSRLSNTAKSRVQPTKHKPKIRRRAKHSWSKPLISVKSSPGAKRWKRGQ